jgi:hypothetical protein
MPSQWPITPDDMKWEQEAADLRHKSLETVRDVAGRWMGSIATVLGIVSTVLFVEGPDKLKDLTHTNPRIVVALSLGAAVAAIAGLVAAIYAAQGMPRWVHHMNGLRLKKLTQDKTQKAVVALKASRIAIALALALLLAGTFYILFAETSASTPATTQVKAIVVTSAGAFCGRLVEGASGRVTLVAGTAQVSLDSASSVTIVTACPST